MLINLDTMGYIDQMITYSLRLLSNKAYTLESDYIHI